MMPNGGPGFYHGYPGPGMPPQGFAGEAGMYASVPMIMHPFGGGSVPAGFPPAPDASVSGAMGYGGMQQQQLQQQQQQQHGPAAPSMQQQQQPGDMQRPPVHPAGPHGAPPGPPPMGPPPTKAPATKGKSDGSVTYVERVRALCGLLAIGNAAEMTKQKPAAMQAAVLSLRNGLAFKETPFADSVEAYLPTSSS